MSEPLPEKLPTLDLALCDYLSPFGWTVTRTTTELQDLIAAHDSVIRVRRIGGAAARWQLVARVSLEVFAKTYTTAWEVADEANTALLRSPYRAGGWVIDRCVSESAAAEQFYDPSVRLVVAAYRVSTRSIPT